MSDSKTEYTPSVDRAGELYSWAYAWRTEDAEGETDLSELRASQRAEFDRMIAKVKAEAQVEALREAAEGINLHEVIPDDEAYEEAMYELCRDDKCLFWDMSRAFQARLHDRADRIARSAGIDSKGESK